MILWTSISSSMKWNWSKPSKQKNLPWCGDLGPVCVGVGCKPKPMRSEKRPYSCSRQGEKPQWDHKLICIAAERRAQNVNLALYCLRKLLQTKIPELCSVLVADSYFCLNILFLSTCNQSPKLYFLQRSADHDSKVHLKTGLRNAAAWPALSAINKEILFG